MAEVGADQCITTISGVHCALHDQPVLMARRPPPSTAGEALCLQVLLQRIPQQTEKHSQL